LARHGAPSEKLEERAAVGARELIQRPVVVVALSVRHAAAVVSGAHECGGGGVRLRVHRPIAKHGQVVALEVEGLDRTLG
jgi:hypothetical protein